MDIRRRKRLITDLIPFVLEAGGVALRRSLQRAPWPPTGTRCHGCRPAMLFTLLHPEQGGLTMIKDVFDIIA